jgi:hypothetical protein
VLLKNGSQPSVRLLCCNSSNVGSRNEIFQSNPAKLVKGTSELRSY